MTRASRRAPQSRNAWSKRYGFLEPRHVYSRASSPCFLRQRSTKPRSGNAQKKSEQPNVSTGVSTFDLKGSVKGLPRLPYAFAASSARDIANHQLQARQTVEHYPKGDTR